jgi:hypothetical protein
MPFTTFVDHPTCIGAARFIFGEVQRQGDSPP